MDHFPQDHFPPEDGRQSGIGADGQVRLATLSDSSISNGSANSQVAPEGILTYRNLPAYGLLRHAAEVIPDRTAFIYGAQRQSYQSLNHDAVRAAAMLQQLGVKPGDRVAVLLPNVPEYIVAANAIWRVGGVVVALSPLMVADEVARFVRSTECEIVITLDMLAPLLEGCEDAIRKTLYVSILEHLPTLQQVGYLWMRHRRTGQWLLHGDDEHTWFQTEVESTRREWKPVEIDTASAPAYILPTGGTTGSPKLVTLSHQNMVANAWQQFEWIGREFASETMLAMLPFFHSYGMSAIMMSSTAMGATMVMHHRFNVRKALQLLEKHQITVMHAVPAMLVAMNERLRDYPSNLDSLRWVISGGAPLKEEIGAEFAEHSGALIVEGYGLSESSPVTHVGDMFGPQRYGTIGLPLPETECRIIRDVSDNSEQAATDSLHNRIEHNRIEHNRIEHNRIEHGEIEHGEIEHGEIEHREIEHTDIGNDQVGELIIRGPQIMLGYWKNQEATIAAIRDGWLHTGDLASRSAEGLFTIVGRRKDLIITSGFNVYPAEVEAVLREAAGVVDAAVVAAPDPQRGEIVKAFVVLKDGVKWDEEALAAHCSEHLSRHKRPRVYEHCLEDLPRNFLGKVIRRKLREQDEQSRDDTDGNINKEKQAG